MLTLILLFALGSGAATFIEAALGTPAARALVYDALWFELVIALLIVNLTVLLFVRAPYRRRQWGFLCIHVAVILILVSSGITRFFGYEGMMHIREGDSSSSMLSSKDYVLLMDGEEEEGFTVQLWKPGKNSVRGGVALGDENYRVGVTEYWPRFAERMMPSDDGRPTLAFAVTDQGERMRRLHLSAGKEVRAGEVNFVFLDGDFEGGDGASPHGELVVNLGGASARVPVSDEAEVDLGGHLLRITTFHADYSRRNEDPAPTAMNNPMIRVAVTGPEGQSTERILFAFFPDFSMNQSGEEDPFPELETRYDYGRRIELSGFGGELRARANFPMDVADMTSGETDHRQPPGEIFTPEMSVLHRSGEFAMVATAFWESASMQPVLSDHENAPAAARIEVVAADGSRGETILRRGEAKDIQVGDANVGVRYGPRRIEVPYRIELADFQLHTYPGSSNPASYESHVKLYDEAAGIDGRPVRIYMNHPLAYRGYKHFQSSYDQDRKGTVLSVNHDPGKWPTYISYILISLGFVLILFKGMLARSESKAAAALLVAMLAAGAPGLARAQGEAQPADDPHAGHDHQHEQVLPVNDVPTKNFLSEASRDALRRLSVQDYQGRMKPLDTLSREMVVKITKRSSFQDWEPLDLYFSWMLTPRYWYEQPVIAVRNPGLKEMLGVSPETTHVSAVSLMNEQGRYRLGPQVEEALRTADRDRSKTQRKLLTFDERVNIIFMNFQQGGLRLYPVPGDENDTWLEVGKIAEQIGEGELLDEYRRADRSLWDALIGQDEGEIRAAASIIGGLQKKHGGDVVVSDLAMKAELSLNKGHHFVRVIMPYLLAWLLMLTAYVLSLAKYRGAPFSLKHPLYLIGSLIYWATMAVHAYAFTLRWIASGRAPLSNGYESLIWISLMVALAGFLFELRERKALTASLGALLTAVVLGVSLLSTFDPAIGPLVPVLASYWLNIHVTVITSSYGFLGLSALMAMAILVLYLFKAPGRDTVKEAIASIHSMHWLVVVSGLGLLAIGTLLGGVWANESWGRYWGWDAKETWSLVTILVYALVSHFRFVKGLNGAWAMATASFLSISSVIMTYFGVNYFLAGLHSYAAGDAATFPTWGIWAIAIAFALIILSGIVNRRRSWESAS